jgi:hypothetical protein
VKIFISWSGEPSRMIAKSFSKWLKMVVQQVDPWMSDDHIQSGARWNEALARVLRDTDYGILCVTRQNQAAPWLLFEAGALAKGLDGAHVVPMCIDMPPSELDPGPLTSFQGRRFVDDDVRRLVHDINALVESPLPPEQLDELFDALWQRLKDDIDAATVAARQQPIKFKRTTEEMLAELVDRVRDIQRRSSLDKGDVARLEDSVILLDRAVSDVPHLEEVAVHLARAAQDIRDIRYE